MYSKVKKPLVSSASLLHNNLDVYNDDGCVRFAVIHKWFAEMVTPFEDKQGDTGPKKVSCKGDNKNSASNLFQVKWCTLSSRTLLVLTSAKGIQMFEPDASIMVFWQALNPHPTEGYAQYAQGIASVGDNYICVGSADGSVFVFDIPMKGTAVKLQETLTEHISSITDLHACNGKLLVGDENGKMTLWKSGGYFQLLGDIKSFGFPCSSVCWWDELVIAGYGSGHIRCFHADSGRIICEINAHSKWINAIDVAPKSGMLLSAAEDSFVRVWDLKKLELLHEDCVENVQLTGARFISDDGSRFAVTGYDSNELFVFDAVR